MLKAGTTITCPECETPQLKSTKDILAGGQMKDANWETFGYDMTAQFMNCYKCGHLWARRNAATQAPQVHTLEHGWIETQKEPPVKKNTI